VALQTATATPSSTTKTTTCFKVLSATTKTRIFSSKTQLKLQQQAVVVAVVVVVVVVVVMMMMMMMVMMMMMMMMMFIQEIGWGGREQLKRMVAPAGRMFYHRPRLDRGFGFCFWGLVVCGLGWGVRELVVTAGGSNMSFYGEAMFCYEEVGVVVVMMMMMMMMIDGGNPNLTVHFPSGQRFCGRSDPQSYGKG